MAAPMLLASTAMSAIGQIQAGKAQKQMYDAQAADAKMKGRSQAIAYKQQGADVLRNLNENLAAIIARSSAGNVDAASGSAAVTQLFGMSEAAREKHIAADNAIMAEGYGEMQAHQYQMAGRAAQKTAMFNAMGTIAQGIFRFGQL
jgi:hypothetical protein